MGRSPFQGMRAGLCLALAALAMTACSGGSNSGSTVGTAPPPNPPGSGDSGCSGNCGNAQSFLTEDDVRKVIAQGVAEARAQGKPSTFVVVDRVGNGPREFRPRRGRRA